MAKKNETLAFPSQREKNKNIALLVMFTRKQEQKLVEGEL
jgi:hypothetical protein